MDWDVPGRIPQGWGIRGWVEGLGLFSQKLLHPLRGSSHSPQEPIQNVVGCLWYGEKWHQPNKNVRIADLGKKIPLSK